MADDENPEELLARASRHDGRARQELLEMYRNRLQHMVRVRMDRRLAARVDPSDVVQEALAEAASKLSDYLREQPVPFYPWLRKLAWEHLVRHYERHLQAGKRSVLREQAWRLPDESALMLARRLCDPGTSPSGQLLRREFCDRVQAALAALPERDREVLVLRYLEGLSTRDTAAVMGVKEGTAKARHVRALERLRSLLENDFGQE